MTNFEYEAGRDDRKRESSQFAETCYLSKKFVKSHQVNLFSVGLGHLEPLWVGAELGDLSGSHWSIK